MSFLPNNLKIDIFSRDDIPKKKNLYCTHLFSITHPGNSQPPEGIDDFLSKPIVYKYNFHDVYSKQQLASKLYKAPSFDDIKSIVRAGEDIKLIVEHGEDIRIFFHCQAGISRSTAAACIILNVIFGPGFEMQILQEIYQMRPIMNPNDLMISLADNILNRNGVMINANKKAKTTLRNIYKGSPWILD